MFSTDHIRLSDFVEGHLVIIYAKWFLILIVDFREKDFVMFPIDESKHYVTNQYHPEHYGLYPKAGKCKLLFTCIGHGNRTSFIAI